MRFRRRRQPNLGAVATGIGAIQLGIISQEELNGLVNDLSVKGLAEMVPWIAERTGVTVEPGSFYVGMLWASAATAGFSRETIAEMISNHDVPEMVTRIRAEV